MDHEIDKHENLKAIETQCPDYRIPNDSDLTYLWASNFLPYITWGDFNGDGRTDIAVILIKEGAWKEVIMHRTDQGYVVALNNDGRSVHFSNEAGIHSHQELLVRRVPKGEILRAFGITFSHDLDSVEFSYSEKGANVYFWKNGKYESVSFFE